MPPMVIKTKKIKRKLAQIKINQMAFMLIGVTIFFALVGIFAINLRFASLKQTASAVEEQNAFLLAAKIANSPEFSCGDAFGGEKSNCIDVDKVMMLKQRISDYQNFWGVSGLEIRAIYLSNTEEIECTLENYPPNCNLIIIKKPSGKSSGFDKGTFVALCKKELKEGSIQDVCQLGKIFIRYEGKY